ncbi:MAG: hypothetical protein ACLTEB_05135 [Blautia obeum]
MKKAKLILLAGLAIAVSLTGCQKKEVKPGDVAGYDEGEQYLSIWVHSIEDTLEGQVYRESVDSFNEKYNGKYFADIEFIPRNDSGGGYSDKVNSSVLSGGLPDVLTLDERECGCLCREWHHTAVGRADRGRKRRISGIHSGSGHL